MTDTKTPPTSPVCPVCHYPDLDERGNCWTCLQRKGDVQAAGAERLTPSAAVEWRCECGSEFWQNPTPIERIGGIKLVCELCGRGYQDRPMTAPRTRLSATLQRKGDAQAAGQCAEKVLSVMERARHYAASLPDRPYFGQVRRELLAILDGAGDEPGKEGT